MRRILFSIFLIFLFQNAFGQMAFSTEVAKEVMQLGDHNTYKIKIVHSPEVTIRSIDLNPIQTTLLESISQRDTSVANNSEKKEALKAQFTQMGVTDELMEIISWGNWTAPNEGMQIGGDEANWKSENIGEQILKTNEIKFTYWQEGGHVIFSPVVTYQEDGALKTITASEVKVTVGSPLSNTQAGTDTTQQEQLDPIKDIIEEPLDVWRDILLPYGGALLGIVGLVSLIYFLVKKFNQKEPPSPEPEIIIPAHQTALEKLDVLEKEELWQKEKIKEYQSQLTYIIREYLENRYDINALENTTKEIKQDLKRLNLDDKLQGELQNILQVADLVKFAKAKPGASVHQEFMEKAKEFVLATKKEIVIEETSD